MKLYQGSIGSEFCRSLRSRLFTLAISMSRFFSLGISMSCLFALWRNVLESRCRCLYLSISGCCCALVIECWCYGFLVLESWCRRFLSWNPIYCGICASTSSFSFSLNLLCHVINVDIRVVNWWKLFCIS